MAAARRSDARKGPRDDAGDEPSPELGEILARLRGLEERLARVETALGPSAPRDDVPQETAHRTAPTASAPPSSVDEPEVAGAAPQTWKRMPDERDDAPTPPRKRDLEEMLGANWLAKAGVALLVLGMVFLFQYAVAQGWLTLQMQILLGFLAGVVLFAVGDFLFARKGLTVYGQILAAGGAVIAYFSVFASYVFPEYREAMATTLEMASMLMGIVVLGVLLYAALRRTPVLASMAAVLGAITVVFAGQWPLFAVVYVLLLTAAVMLVALWRDWEEVAGVALGAALTSLLIGVLMDLDVVPAAWSAAGVGALGLAVAAVSRWPRVATAVMPGAVLLLLVTGSSQPASSLWAGSLLLLAVGCVVAWRSWLGVHGVALVSGFVLVFLLAVFGFQEFSGRAEKEFAVLILVITGVVSVLFSAVAGHLVAKAPRDEQNWAGGAVAFAALAAWGVALYTLETVGWGVATGWTTLGLAVIVSALALVPRFLGPVRFGWMVAGIVLWLAWPPILLSGVPVTLIWVVFLAALGSYVIYSPSWVARVFMGATGVLVLIHLFGIQWVELNRGEMTWLLGLLLFGLATMALLVAWVGERRNAQEEGDKAYAWLFLMAGLVVPILYFSAVLEGFLVSVAWALQAVAMVVLGFVLQLRELRLTALGVFGLVVFRLLIFDMQEVDTGLRIISFLAVGALLIVAAYFFARRARAPQDGSEAMKRRG